MKTMGDRIALRLKELNKSQGWLAKLVGIQQPSLNKVIKSPESGTKHVVALAEHLGVHAKWLQFGTGPKLLEAKREALLVGEVGAGAEVIRLEEGVVLEGVEPPPGIDACLAARIKGESMYPLEDGWLLFYEQEHRGIPEECIGKICVVGLRDGTTLVKKLRRGTRKQLWRLESWNAPARDDQPVIWASRVIDIRPV